MYATAVVPVAAAALWTAAVFFIAWLGRDRRPRLVSLVVTKKE